jgi:hypothetical protein
MAFDLKSFNLPSFTAAASLATKKFHAVKITAADTVNICTGATDVPVGILQNAPASGEACEIPEGGIVKAICGGVVAAGNWVGTDANGKLVVKSADKDYVLGQALEAGADGTIIAVLMRPCYLAA